MARFEGIRLNRSSAVTRSQLQRLISTAGGTVLSDLESAQANAGTFVQESEVVRKISMISY